MTATCHAHGLPLVKLRSRPLFGVVRQLLGCPHPGPHACTVAVWSPSTAWCTVPADQTVRELRSECHLLFDPLWRDKTWFLTRDQAYDWVARTLCLPREDAHIGSLGAMELLDLRDQLIAITQIMESRR